MLWLQMALTGRVEAETLIEMPGGDLRVIISDRGTEKEQVFLQGAADFVFEGEIEL